MQNLIEDDITISKRKTSLNLQTENVSVPSSEAIMTQDKNQEKVYQHRLQGAPPSNPSKLGYITPAQAGASVSLALTEDSSGYHSIQGTQTNGGGIETLATTTSGGTILDLETNEWGYISVPQMMHKLN